MSLKKNGKGVIRLGETTDHGGKVISVAHKPTEMDNPNADTKLRSLALPRKQASKL